jgi:hypothetical protein
MAKVPVARQILFQVSAGVPTDGTGAKLSAIVCTRKKKLLLIDENNNAIKVTLLH